MSSQVPELSSNAMASDNFCGACFEVLFADRMHHRYCIASHHW